MRQKLVLPDADRRVGCLGLSANPPHKGHLMVARDMLASGLVDVVLLIPVFRHAFAKPDVAPWEDRLAMLRLLVQGEQRMRVCTIEQELGGTSYTHRTLGVLEALYPCHEFYWIMGGDIVARGDYKSWKNWNMLEHTAQFIAVPRSGYFFRGSTLPPCFRQTPGRERDDDYESNLSSTLVREMIRNGQDITRAVGENCAAYIHDHKLYQTSKEE